MATRFRGKRIAAILFALLVLVPASVSYAQNQENGSSLKKAEKFVDIAEQAKTRLDDLAEPIGGIPEELEDDYELALDALVEASSELVASEPDLSLVVDRAKEAMRILRRLFGQVHAYLEESGVDTESEAQAQGLIVAMERALERIERLRELEGLPLATSWILDNATLYLDLPVAEEWLNQRRVNETAYNLTQANKLISLAHSTLRAKALELKTQRITNYKKVIGNLFNRLSRQVGKLEDNENLKTKLGEAEDHIDNAREAEDAQALGELLAARNILEEVEQGLKEQRRVGNGGD